MDASVAYLLGSAVWIAALLPTLPHRAATAVERVDLPGQRLEIVARMPIAPDEQFVPSAVSEDGRYLSAVYGTTIGTTVVVWDLRDGTRTAEFKPPTGARPRGFSADGGAMLLPGNGIVAWKRYGDKWSPADRYRDIYRRLPAHLSRDGNMVVYQRSNPATWQVVRLPDRADGQAVEITLNVRDVIQAVPSTDGKHVLALTMDRDGEQMLVECDAAAGHETRRWSVGNARLRKIIFNRLADGADVVAVGAWTEEGGELFFVDTISKSAGTCLAQLNLRRSEAEPGYIDLLQVALDGKHLLVCGKGNPDGKFGPDAGGYQVFATDADRPRNKLPPTVGELDLRPFGPIPMTTFAADGASLYIVTRTGAVLRWYFTEKP
jgi:hypothetical protein